MAISVPDIAEALLLQYIVGLVAPGSPVIHLYEADLTPSETTTIGDFSQTAKAGYTAITLTSTYWTVSTLVGSPGGVTTAMYSQQTFSFTTGADIYGYYITDSSAALLWCERFTGAPFRLPSGGGTIAISPRVTLD
jgi:hypothetical protein